MDQLKAIEAFAALAQDTRMSIYRLLVKRVSQSVRASEISDLLKIVPSTLSGHLAILKRAGLLKATRHQREIRYAADIAAMNELISFLLQDCCDGQMSNCGEILTLLKAPEN
ncbi:MAG: winged helix-turn-helix transcriptional regulator [Rhodobacteraceae bacterium]|nr:winged helix-turn-helix transcriptional regulator [Paracoccaceae bacterium]